MTSKVLFVRKIPFQTTSEDLEKVFEDYGPLKRCYVVKDKESDANECRGFGYVTFALLQDAEKAISSQVTIGDRTLQISFADKRERKRKKSTSDEPEEQIVQKKQKRTEGKKEADPRKRTVCVTGVMESINKEAIKKKCRTYGTIEEIQFQQSENEFKQANIIFKDYKDAVRAFQKISGTSFCGSTVFAHLLSQETKRGSKKMLEKSRLIVRNIDFKCAKEEIIKVFSRIGPIHDINLPMTEKNDTKCNKGFCFVTFKSKPMAEQAMKLLNGSLMKGRNIVIDWAVDQQNYTQKIQLTEKQQKERIEKNAEDKDDDEVEGENENKNEDEKQVIKEDSVSSHDESELSSEEDAITETNEMLVEEENSSDITDEDHDFEDKSQVVKKAKDDLRQEKLTDAKEGKTLFVRNIPFECDTEEIEDLFSEFGDIDYCQIVINPDTGHSRGTCFVKFSTVKDADNCIEEAERRASLHDHISLHGRELLIVKALPRQELDKIKTNETKQKAKVDSRNMYLASEGVMLKNKDEQKNLPLKDQQKREKAWAEKKKKLKDVDTFVSRTRLCLRNLPVSSDEKKLKECITNVCKVPLRRVKQVKIMRDKDRIQANGLGRPLGYAFVEFLRHEDALQTLHVLNNNTEVFGDSRRPIVDFAVENKRIMKMRKERMERSSSARIKQERMEHSGNEGTKREKIENPKNERTIQRGMEYSNNEVTKRERLEHSNSEGTKREGMEHSNVETKRDGFRKETNVKDGKKERTNKLDLGKSKRKGKEQETFTDQKITGKKMNKDKKKSSNKKEGNADRSHKVTPRTEVQKMSKHTNDVLIAERNTKVSEKPFSEPLKPKIPKKKSKEFSTMKEKFDEQKFRTMVNSYRNKLFRKKGENSDAGRWFEV